MISYKNITIKILFKWIILFCLSYQNISFCEIVDENKDNNYDHESNFESSNSKGINYKWLLFIFLISSLIGGLYFLQLGDNINLPNLLNEIKTCVDEITYQQIHDVVQEIINVPPKKKAGIELLKIMKLIVKPSRIKDIEKFNACIDNIIQLLIEK